jgi:hypothetical protein
VPNAYKSPEAGFHCSPSSALDSNWPKEFRRSLRWGLQRNHLLGGTKYLRIDLPLTIGREFFMRIILLIIVVLLVLGALPTWPYSSGWGYYPSGGLGLILIILLILVLMGRL